jgi:hypothetical protein
MRLLAAEAARFQAAAGYPGRVISMHRAASRSNVSADISNPRAAVPPI